MADMNPLAYTCWLLYESYQVSSDKSILKMKESDCLLNLESSISIPFIANLPGGKSFTDTNIFFSLLYEPPRKISNWKGYGNDMAGIKRISNQLPANYTCEFTLISPILL